MCDSCGCSITGGNPARVVPDGRTVHTEEARAEITLAADLLAKNDHQAMHNREHFERHGVLALNLMSSPGAGKTSLLEATIEALGDELRIAVIEGDLETENDAERIRAHGVPAVQISTGNACHLDAHMVHDALHEIDLHEIDLLFIENVGNLVCPASFDLGQHRNITLLSVPEGDDKPAKYPVMFRAADLVLLAKSDLLPYLTEFSPTRAEQYLRRLATLAPFLEITTRDPEGIDPWIGWLRDQVRDMRAESGQEKTSQASREAPFSGAEGGQGHHLHHRDRRDRTHAYGGE
jgi:hydrogenase nickel incorporation protein HypB